MSVSMLMLAVLLGVLPRTPLPLRSRSVVPASGWAGSVLIVMSCVLLDPGVRLARWCDLNLFVFVSSPARPDGIRQ
jgi:hypothetical protein